MGELEETEEQIIKESNKCIYIEKQIQINEILRYYEYETHSEKWGNAKKSSYIQSIILSYPLSPFLLMEFGENYVIIDGNERIKSIIDFVNRNLRVKLKNEKKSKSIDYDDLSLSRKNKIMRTNLTALVLNESTDSETLYEIYNSLNVQYDRMIEEKKASL